MKRLLLLAVLLGTAVFVLGPAAPASAQPGIIQTRCDTLSAVPPLVRVTFAVLNNGPVPVCSVHLTPIPSGITPPDSCRILQCSSPPGWVCQVDPASGSGSWQTLPGFPCIGFGQKTEGFDVELDPLFCCYRAEFDDPNGQIFYATNVCFECEKPTPNRSSTWGDLKLLYR
ncbi:MAG: hypothetical protein A2W00_11860 [Candidatus Eisenbacteria bacterium RBG_16_71_46]|nr:MAG: hypothetical protein A2W00_11860 [Candidatus Eisenbacteria bacterium RBG_16_71_46]OGF24519.1 MAG: hypothetical protein A2V63_09620 [Candidatus Eisenbacteria bacterium RBG_19FT_COMBO_70_11]